VKGELCSPSLAYSLTALGHLFPCCLEPELCVPGILDTKQQVWGWSFLPSWVPSSVFELSCLHPVNVAYHLAGLAGCQRLGLFSRNAGHGRCFRVPRKDWARSQSASARNDQT
jgi:hypothetical protein